MNHIAQRKFGDAVAGAHVVVQASEKLLREALADNARLREALADANRRLHPVHLM